LVWSAAQLPILIPAAGYTVLLATRVMLGAAWFLWRSRSSYAAKPAVESPVSP